MAIQHLAMPRAVLQSQPLPSYIKRTSRVFHTITYIWNNYCATPLMFIHNYSTCTHLLFRALRLLSTTSATSPASSVAMPPSTNPATPVTTGGIQPQLLLTLDQPSGPLCGDSHRAVCIHVYSVNTQSCVHTCI